MICLEIFVVADLVVRHSRTEHLKRAEMRGRVVSGVVREPKVSPTDHWLTLLHQVIIKRSNLLPLSCKVGMAAHLTLRLRRNALRKRVQFLLPRTRRKPTNTCATIHHTGEHLPAPAMNRPPIHANGKRSSYSTTSLRRGKASCHVVGAKSLFPWC